MCKDERAIERDASSAHLASRELASGSPRGLVDAAKGQERERERGADRAKDVGELAGKAEVAIQGLEVSDEGVLCPEALRRPVPRAGVGDEHAQCRQIDAVEQRKAEMEPTAHEVAPRVWMEANGDALADARGSL